MEEQKCANCHITLMGKYCYNCGEKMVSPYDFSLTTILQNAVDSFLSLDGKIFRTLKFFIFKPGFLVEEYFSGRRMPYMKPFQIFIWCNIIFFFFLGNFDIFLIPSKWFFIYADNQYGIRDMVTKIAAGKGISIQELAILYDKEVSINSKLYIVLLTPLLSLTTFFFGRRSTNEIGKHFIFALYLLSFFLILTVITSSVLKYLPFEMSKYVAIVAVLGVFMLYIYKSLGHFLSQPIYLRILTTMLFCAIFITLELNYRFIVSFLTLKYI